MACGFCGRARDWIRSPSVWSWSGAAWPAAASCNRLAKMGLEEAAAFTRLISSGVIVVTGEDELEGFIDSE